MGLSSGRSHVPWSFSPKQVQDLVISPGDPDWKPKFKAALAQQRIWEDRTVNREPPRKVPF